LWLSVIIRDLFFGSWRQAPQIDGGQVNDRGLEKDELKRAIKPILTSIKERIKTNTYWLNSVLKRASRYPAQLDWCRSFQKDYAAITEQEVNVLARKYLVNANAATVVIVPETNENSEQPVIKSEKSGVPTEESH